MTKTTYTISENTATCTAWGFDNAEWNSEQYIGFGEPDYYNTIEEAKKALETCHAEISINREYTDGTKEYEVRYFHIDKNEVDAEGDIIDSKTICDNYDDLAKMIEEVRDAE